MENEDVLGLYRKIRKISSEGIRVFQALISSIFLYTSDIRSFSKAQKNQLDASQRLFLRQIMRNRIIATNEIYKLCNIEPWSNDIKRQRLKWFGNLVRLSENAPAKQAVVEAKGLVVANLTGRELRSGVKCIVVTIVTGSRWLVRRYRWGQVKLKTISTIPSH